jgi:hypothetical protein
LKRYFRLTLLFIAFPLFIAAGFPSFVSADVIIFKNGTKLSVDSAWEQDGEVKARVYGGFVGYSAGTVERIEHKRPIPEHPGRGFKFDKWVSGMTIEDAMQVAETNDIPLLREGLISPNKHFNPKASRDYAGTATDFYYRESSLEKPAKITLSFTPTKKRLWSVTISWGGIGVSKRSNFCTEVVSLISEKYGKPKTGKWGILFDTWNWKINTTGSIFMKAASGIGLKYVDEEMKQLKMQEEASIEKRKKEAYLLKDKPKY